MVERCKKKWKEDQNLNMEIKAKLKNLRIAPRKVRLVADTIRGKNVSDAINILSFVINKPSEPILKLLNSAVTSAKDLYNLEDSDLFVSKIIVNEGIMLKRWRPRARGSASLIQKKSSHVEITLKPVEGIEVKKREVIKEIPKKTIKESESGVNKKKKETSTKKKINVNQYKESNKGKLKTDKVASKIFRRKSI